MSVIGIVCEFNPFHKGHKYLIDSVKKSGDTVVCVMSGNFVQRGEPALFPKETRVKSALMNGADIVLELPFVYATASAEIFAYNAVKILECFGCDILAFGTESASVEELNNAVEILNSNDFDDKIKKYLTPGKALYFSHGFGITYKERTGIVHPEHANIRKLCIFEHRIIKTEKGGRNNSFYPAHGIALCLCQLIYLLKCCCLLHGLINTLCQSPSPVRTLFKG